MSVAGGLPLDPEPGRASGYCRECGHYGRGQFDDIRTALTDWIVDHIGCPGVPTGRSDRDPDDVWA